MKGVEFDVIILGCGASGMMAAIAAHEKGLKVGIFEKEPVIGGTAAISGGIIWAPMNTHMNDANIHDSKENALDYFMSLSQGDIDPELLNAFIENCSEAISFLEETTPVSLSILEGYPDYYLDRPGAISGGGRALDNALFSFQELGDWKTKVRSNEPSMPLTLSETPLGGGTGHIDESIMIKRKESDSRGMGQALIGALLKGCLDRGIEPFTEAKALKLITDENSVVGAEIQIQKTVQKIKASRGVIIATGGFEWNKDLVSAFLRGPMTHPASPPSNTGDGLIMAQEIGASLNNMTSAWWTPVLAIPENSWEDGHQRSAPVLMERTLPHSIMINREGKRFCNEATNYSALAGAFQSFDPKSYSYSNLPAWIVFDSSYRSNYLVGNSLPGTKTPNWMIEDNTLEGLEDKIGIKKESLSNTVNRFNMFVEKGIVL